MFKLIGFGLIGLALTLLLPVFLFGVVVAIMGGLAYLVYEAIKYEKEISDEIEQTKE